MKRFACYSIMVVLLTLFSCNAIKKLGQFYVNYSAQAVFPANLPVNLPVTIPTPPIATNSQQVFQSNNTRSNLIQSVRLDQLTLNITSPAEQTFSFLQNISVYVSSDSLPEVEIASKQNIPLDAGDTLVLDVSGADLENYIKASQIKLRVSGTTRQLVTSNINVNMNARFMVQANLLAVF